MVLGNVLEEKKNTMTNTRRKTNTKLTEMKKYCLELDELPPILDSNDFTFNQEHQKDSTVRMCVGGNLKVTTF